MDHDYLTLALKIRNITDFLIRLVESGTTDNGADAVLLQLMIGLLSGRLVFDDDKWGRLLSEVADRRGRSEILASLTQVLTSSLDQRRKAALSLIPFLDAAERRALHLYRRRK